MPVLGLLLQNLQQGQNCLGTFSVMFRIRDLVYIVAMVNVWHAELLLNPTRDFAVFCSVVFLWQPLTFPDAFQESRHGASPRPKREIKEMIAIAVFGRMISPKSVLY